MKMRKCPSCKAYTFKRSCPECGEKTVSPSPPSFSLEKYGKYRRKIQSMSKF